MQTSHDHNDTYSAVVSDLVSRIEHVQNGLRLIERIIASEATHEPAESSTNVIVLDDISPRYMKAATAVQACDVNLGVALRALLDSDVNDSSVSNPPVPAVIGA